MIDCNFKTNDGDKRRKIIDDGTTHDKYGVIMDLYDSGAIIESMHSKIPFPQSDYYEDFNFEIYTTSHGLAIWKIGHTTDDVVQEAKPIL